MLAQIGGILLVLLAAAQVAYSVYIFLQKGKRYELAIKIWSRFNATMFVQAFAMVLLTVLIFAALAKIPYFNLGWSHLFFDVGGNILFAPLMASLSSTSSGIQALIFLFLASLLVILPQWAKWEEDYFRRTHEDWEPIVLQSIKFGFMHCVVGVPIAAGIALILPGLFYGYHYKRTVEWHMKKRKKGRKAAEDEAVLVATAHHTLFNSVVVVAVASLLLGSWAQ